MTIQPLQPAAAAVEQSQQPSVGKARARQVPQRLADGQAAATAPAPQNDGERAFAHQALEVLANSAGGDYAKFCDLLAANTLISKHFDQNSSEVRALFPEHPF